MDEEKLIPRDTDSAKLAEIRKRASELVSEIEKDRARLSAEIEIKEQKLSRMQAWL